MAAPAGASARDYMYYYPKDSVSSLRKPESWDEGDLPPHRVLGRGGIFPQNSSTAAGPLSGPASRLYSTSTKVGTPVGFGTCESWDEHVSDSTFSATLAENQKTIKPQTHNGFLDFLPLAENPKSENTELTTRP